MANFLAQQIIDENTTYTAVVAKYPNLKSKVDTYLMSKGREDLIVTA